MQPRAGHTPERVKFFADAVLAIAMTLLAVELPRPEGADFEVGDGSRADSATRLWDFLVEERAAFTSYLLAFFILWIVWRQHHVLFDQLDRVNASMVRWHFPLLLLVGFLPYSTSVAGRYVANPLASVLFGVTVALIFFCRTMVLTAAHRDDLFLPDVDRPEIRRELIALWGIVAFWLLVTALALLTPWAQFAWFLTSLVAGLINRLTAKSR